jgi:Fe-S-cluster containining protein
MRHKADRYFGTICRFFDTNERRCTIYHARPLGCRTYPGTKHCAYYDFLIEERERQHDDKMVLTTDHRD